MNAIFVACRFRRSVKKMPSFETPEWVPVVLALRGLIESAERLLNVTKGGTHEGYTSDVGICGYCGSVVSDDGVQRRQGVSGL